MKYMAGAQYELLSTVTGDVVHVEERRNAGS
jgi:hypothetical protein